MIRSGMGQLGVLDSNYRSHRAALEPDNHSTV